MAWHAISMSIINYFGQKSNLCAKQSMGRQVQLKLNATEKAKKNKKKLKLNKMLWNVSKMCLFK